MTRSAVRPALVLGLAITLAANLPSASAEPYAGALYDTHAHQDDDGYASRLAPRMAERDVRHSVLFMFVQPRDVEIVQEELSPHPGAFVPFFHIDPDDPSDLDRERLEAVLAVDDVGFKGFGETAFYRDPWQGEFLDHERWHGIFDLAAERNLVLMIHLRGDQEQDLRTMLAAHPEAKVLLHGFELLQALPALLRDHDNLYYTLDTATLLARPGNPAENRPPTNLMYGVAGKTEFIQRFDAERARLLEDSFADWAPVVAAAPERVMWGTDVSMDWHVDPQVYERLVSFSRDWIAMLPEAQRAPFAFDNAMALLGEGVTVDDPVEDNPIDDDPGDANDPSEGDNDNDAPPDANGDGDGPGETGSANRNTPLPAMIVVAAIGVALLLGRRRR